MSTEKNVRPYQLFKGRQNPLSRCAKIWRYLTFEKYVALLESKQLHHARLDRLGDPFEGSVTKPYAEKRDSGELPEILDSRDPDGALNNMRRQYIMFVSCWHISEIESDAMWKLYSRDHAGVAIVSTPKRMQESVELEFQDNGILGPVEYFDFDKDDMIVPMGLKGRVGYSKRKTFSHEREARAMIHLVYQPGDTNDLFSATHLDHLRQARPVGIGRPVDLKRLIAEIYISPLSPEWFADVVQRVSHRHGIGELVKPSGLLGDPVY